MDLQTLPGVGHSSARGFKHLVGRNRLVAGAILVFVALLLAQAPAWSGPSLSGQSGTEQGWPSELLRQAERDARSASEAEVSCGGTCALGDEKELKAFLDQWEKLRTIPRIEIPRLPPGLFRSKQPPEQREGAKQQSPTGWSKGVALGESSGSACGNQPCLCGRQGGNCGAGALATSDGTFVPKASKKFKIDGSLVSGSSEQGGGLRVLSYMSESDSDPRGTGGQGSGANYTGSQGGSRTDVGGEQGGSAQPSAIDSKTDGSLLASLDTKSPDADTKPAVAADPAGPKKDGAGGSTAATGPGTAPSGAGPATATDGGKRGGTQIAGSGGDKPPKVTDPKVADGLDKKAGGSSSPQTGSSGSTGGAGGNSLSQGAGKTLPSAKPEPVAGSIGATAETPLNMSCPPGGCANQIVGNTVTTGQHDSPQKLIRNVVQPLPIPVDPPKPQPQPLSTLGNPSTGNPPVVGTEVALLQSGNQRPPIGGSGNPEPIPQQYLGGDGFRTHIKKTGGLAAKQIVDFQSLMFLDNAASSGLQYQDKPKSQGPATRTRTSKIDPSLLRITKATELTITNNARLESLGVQPRTPGDGRLTARTGAVKVVPMAVTTPKVNVTRTGVTTPKVTIQAQKIDSSAARVRITEPKVVSPKVIIPKINAPRVSAPQGSISDVRLKRDIVRIGQLASGHSIYRYRYLWDDTFYVGVLAQEIAVTAPEAVVRGFDGYLRVAYDRLGLKLMTWDEWLRAQAAQPMPSQ